MGEKTAFMTRDVTASQAGRETRDRENRIKVAVSDSERAEIERLAAVAGLPVSTYLRTAALHCRINSVYDLDAVRELMAVAGGIGRVGGLLKLWLSEYRDSVPVAEFNRALLSLHQTQDLIREALKYIRA